MTAAPKIKAKFLPIIGDDHTGAGATYTVLSSPLIESVLAMVISSTYDESVFLSTDGVKDHIFMLPNAIMNIGFSENKQNIGRLQLPIGTEFFLKQGPDGPPTTGDLFISFIFAG